MTVARVMAEQWREIGSCGNIKVEILEVKIGRDD